MKSENLGCGWSRTTSPSSLSKPAFSSTSSSATKVKRLFKGEPSIASEPAPCTSGYGNYSSSGKSTADGFQRMSSPKVASSPKIASSNSTTQKSKFWWKTYRQTLGTTWKSGLIWSTVVVSLLVVFALAAVATTGSLLVKAHTQGSQVQVETVEKVNSADRYLAAKKNQMIFTTETAPIPTSNLWIYSILSVTALVYALLLLACILLVEVRPVLARGPPPVLAPAPPPAQPAVPPTRIFRYSFNQSDPQLDADLDKEWDDLLPIFIADWRSGGWPTKFIIEKVLRRDLPSHLALVIEEAGVEGVYAKERGEFAQLLVRIGLIVEDYA